GNGGSHLRSWFKAATGMTVHRYLVVERVRRARDLLVEGRLSSDEIAWATGFSHQSHMACWIRRELGCSPRDIRSGRRSGDR
ncbi:MAG TPA: helix-turn-helix transcriptional regulator, partial [Brevundimonas sp.]